MAELVRLLQQYYSRAKDTEKVIIECAVAAAAADLIGAWVPGLAIPAAVVSCFGAVWAMYARLCSTLGISIKENALKLIARAALANITANLAGALAVAFAGMFVPVFSAVVSAGFVFAVVYLAGLIFLNLILRLAQKSNDPYHFSDISEADMETATRSVRLDKDDLKAAQDAYKKNK